MRAKHTLCTALTLVLASATAGFAQQLQYDRTGDHMASYGPVTGASPAPIAQHPTRVRTSTSLHGPAVPIDRTGDHMLYYGPVQ
jgi:hypothetical protein